MICNPCASNDHPSCKGGMWCDCQHKGVAQRIAPKPIESGEEFGEV